MTASPIRERPAPVEAGNGAGSFPDTRQRNKSTPDSRLFQEFARAADTANRPEVRRWLASHCVPLDMLYFGGCALVGAARIDITDPPRDGAPGAYQPGAAPAIVVACCDISAPISEEDGSGADPLDTIHDIAAWLPDRADKLYLRAGAADLLNPEAATRAWELDKPLIVHRNPLAWLQGRGAGCVVLDMRHPLPLILGNVRRILCPDKGAETRLRHGLTVEPPEIRIMGDCDA